MRKKYVFCFIIFMVLVLFIVRDRDFYYTYKDIEEANRNPEIVTMMTDCFIKDPDAAELFEEICYKDTGIKLKIINSSKNDWQLFLMTKFTSNEIADIIKSPDNITPLVKNDKIIPLTEHILSSEKMYNLYKKSPELMDHYIFDEEIYAIGKNRTTTKNLWIRKDIIDKLGLDIPDSLDEFTKMLCKVKEYTDKEDMSVILVKGDVFNLNIFASAFGLRMDIFMYDGEYVDPFFMPEFHEFASYMKHLYDNDFFDESFPLVNNYNKIRTKFGEGKSFSIVMWDNIYSSLSVKLEKNGITYFKLAPLPAFETEKGVFGLEYIPPGEPFTITKSCKKPEAAFKVLEWIYTDEDGILASSFGILGHTYNVDNGKVVDFDTINHFGQGFPPVDKDFVFPFELPKRIETLLYHFENIQDDIAHYEKVLPKKTMAFDHEEYGMLYPKIQKKRDELFFGYITGKITFDEMINHYRDFYIKYNIDKIIKEFNSEL